MDFDSKKLSGLNLPELRQRFLDLFRDALRLRLVSDVPLGEWLRSGLREHAERVMKPDFLDAQRIFRPEAVGRLCQEHPPYGGRNQRGPLWMLLALQLWHEHHKPEFARSHEE